MTSRLIRFFVCLLFLSVSTAHGQTTPPKSMTLSQLLQQVVHYYPSIEVATLQVEKARQTATLIESNLGWQLGVQAGIKKDMSLFGSPVTSLNVGGQMTRQLVDGDSMIVSTNINRDDADLTLPTLPNPALNSSLELQYRKPLRQGKDNIDYQVELKQADVTVNRLTASKQRLFDQLAEQLIDLYAGMLATQKRINTVNETIKHTQRLHQFIVSRVNFGIAEDKDKLQTNAQLRRLEAQLEVLSLARTNQLININRLLGQPWQTPLTLTSNDRTPNSDDLKFIYRDITSHSPALLINAAEIALADSVIQRQLNSNQDKLDLVFSIGHRGLNGDSASGGIHNNEIVGGVQVEFGRALDNSSNDTALFQAKLERDIALQNRKQITRDLDYTIAKILADLRGIASAIKAYNFSVSSEHAKLDEAEQRYRAGRITIDQVIQFENETATSELELALQKIDYQRTQDRLDLLRGVLWKNIIKPTSAAANKSHQQGHQH